MRKSVIGVVGVLLAGGVRGEVQREDGLNACVGSNKVFESVVTTPTNMVIKVRNCGFLFDYSPKHRKPVSAEEGGPNNPSYIILNLTPDQETRLFEHHISILFNPVLFKDQQKGIQIIGRFNATSFGGRLETNYTAYVAFADTLTEKKEEDVETIMEGKRNPTGYFTGEVEWKKFEPVAKKPPPTTVPVPPPAREQPPEPTVGTPPQPAPADAPASVAEDEPSGEKSNASPLWLCALIPLFLLAVFYFLRRKKR
jgi:hypothetical protein